MSDGIDTLRKHAGRKPVEPVETVRLDLQILNEIGTFVRIYAGGLTMFVRRANWRELGVPAESARRLRYRRPPKYLIDPEVPDWFRNCAQRARDLLNSIGQNTEFMMPYRWIGYRNWDDWTGRFGSIASEWANRKAEVIQNWDHYFEGSVEHFTKSANEAFDALREANAEHIPDRQTFVDMVVTGVVSDVPTREHIEDHLVLEYIVPSVVTPADLQQQLLAADRVRHQRELEAQRAQQQRVLERKRAAVEMDRELDERQARMFEQRLEQLHRQAESLQAPLEQILDQLYGEIEETTQRTLEVLSEHGSLRGRSGEGLRNLLGRVQMLEELGENRLLAAVREASTLTESTGDETDDQADARIAVLEGTLRQISTLLDAGGRARQQVDLVAREMEKHSWHSICLAQTCRHVWASEGSLEPVFCPRCKGNRVASRQVS